MTSTATQHEVRQSACAAMRALPPRRAIDGLIVAAWMGLVVGLVEAAYTAYQEFALGHLTFLPSEAYWMAPLAQVVVCTFAALPVWIVLVWRSQSCCWSPIVTSCGALAWLGVLALVPGLNLIAHITLAIGLAAFTGRIYNRFATTSLLVVRRTTPWLATAVVVILIGQQIAARTRASAPRAAAAEVAENRPNVLFVVLDTLRADVLAAYGGATNSAPFLNELASRGVVFERAYSTAPWTLPSMASMFTGRLPSALSVGWNSPLDGEAPTLAEALRQAGYSTAGFVANTRYCSRQTGIARGFDHYEDYQFHPSSLVQSTAIGRKLLTSNLAPLVGVTNDPGRITAEDLNGRLLNWLSTRPDRPFFAFLNYFDVHHPYVPPAPFDAHAPADAHQRRLFLHWWWVHKEHVEAHEFAVQRAAYFDCLRYLDRQLQALFDELQDRGILQNTIVIVTADHGEHFGEHGLYLHGNSLYEPLVHVPLLIIAPDQFSGEARCPVPVSLAAMPSTVLDLVGLKEDERFQARSLMDYWTQSGEYGSAEAPPVHMQVEGPPGGPLPCQGHSPVAGGAMEAVIVGHKKRIRHADGHEEAYDLASDPGELVDLAGDEFVLTRP